MFCFCFSLFGFHSSKLGRVAVLSFGQIVETILIYEECKTCTFCMKSTESSLYLSLSTDISSKYNQRLT